MPSLPWANASPKNHLLDFRKTMLSEVSGEANAVRAGYGLRDIERIGCRPASAAAALPCFAALHVHILPQLLAD